MATVDDLHSRLRIAARLLDGAAREIRDLPLAPRKENIRHIAEALSNIFDIMQAIYAVRPDLTPAYLKAPRKGPRSEANKRLTHAFGKALGLVDQGQTAAAIELLSSYVASEPSQFHKQLALDEINRLKDGTET